MKIAAPGTGCNKCIRTYDPVREALARAGVEASVRTVEDIREITAFKVPETPAVAIDGEVNISGRVPAAAEVVAPLQTTR